MYGNKGISLLLHSSALILPLTTVAASPVSAIPSNTPYCIEAHLQPPLQVVLSLELIKFSPFHHTIDNWLGVMGR